MSSWWPSLAQSPVWHPTGPTILRDGDGGHWTVLSPLAWPQPGSFPTDLGDHRRASAERAARHGVKPRWQRPPSPPCRLLGCWY